MKVRHLFVAFAIVLTFAVGTVGTASANTGGVPKNLVAARVCPRADAIQANIDKVQAKIQAAIDAAVRPKVVKGLQRVLDRVNAEEARFQAFVAANCVPAT